MGKVLAGGYRANKMMRFVVPLLAAMLTAFAASAQEWGQVSTPTAGPTQSIGFYTAGCLQGAQALPLDGPGYEAIRISRNRYWGQPVPLDFIPTLSEKVRAVRHRPLAPHSPDWWGGSATRTLPTAGSPARRAAGGASRRRAAMPTTGAASRSICGSRAHR